MYFLLKDNFVKIKQLTHKIKNVIRNCQKCQLNKNFNEKHCKLSGKIDAEFFNEKVSSDILGPLKTRHFKFMNKHEYFYIVTFTDVFSKLTEIDLIFSIESKNILKSFINKWIGIHGVLMYFISDQGRQYIASNFGNELENLGIKQILTSAHNPTGNSVSERKNAVILQVCRMCKQSTKKELLKNIWIRLNVTPSTISRKTLISLKSITRPEDRDSVLMKIKRDEKHKKNNDNKRINKKRKYYEYKEGEFVYKRVFSPDKLDAK
ncbi:Retrovirus-related Pol polyprotein from transposon [Dictyocoela muelleri]|nr:Retrovirus-related Pol polyprotein from transposon [Dictyocoela muelleri]